MDCVCSALCRCLVRATTEGLVEADEGLGLFEPIGDLLGLGIEERLLGVDDFQIGGMPVGHQRLRMQHRFLQ